MNITAIDTECTTSNKGNPFDQTNKLCAIAGRASTELGLSAWAHKIEHDAEPYGEAITWWKVWLAEDVDLLVGFNLKFDLNWLHRYGIVYHGRIWDCQLFEHFASSMLWIYPSLAESCVKRGVNGNKYEDIVTQYWDKGIDTTEIPWEIVEKRVTSDAILTYNLYIKQLDEYHTWSKARQNLFQLQCQDLLVLHEIERNGFHYDEEKGKEEAGKTQCVLDTITHAIHALIRDTRPNLNSNVHVSAILYGGTVAYKRQIEDGTYKTGQKVGQTRLRWIAEEVVYPRLVIPFKDSETEKEGVWSVDKNMLGRYLLKKLGKIPRTLIMLLLQHANESRKLSTYLEGLSKTIAQMHWEPNMLHGTINQVTVRTGRTSSSRPNIQNLAGDLKFLFTSRYGHKDQDFITL